MVAGCCPCAIAGCTGGAIADRGALVSEWERGEPGGRWAFVERNRLIAALSAATVVVIHTPADDEDAITWIDQLNEHLQAFRRNALATLAYAEQERLHNIGEARDVSRTINP